MSQHSSLRSKLKDVAQRSVLKRYERLKELEEKEKWKEEESVYGLPKLKVVKFKIKKEKAAKGEEVTPVAAGTPEAQGLKAPTGKDAPGAKAPAGKETPGKVPTGKDQAAKPGAQTAPKAAAKGKDQKK